MVQNKVLWGFVLVVAVFVLFFGAVSYSTGGITNTATPSYETKVVGVTTTVLAAEVSESYQAAQGQSTGSSGSSYKKSSSGSSNNYQEEFRRSDAMRNQNLNTIHNTRSGGMYF